MRADWVAGWCGIRSEAHKAQARQGVVVRKKTAVVVEPLQALLATCNDGVRGIRDRALLLLARSGGGRRRSEVVGLQVGDVRRLDADTWRYALGTTKTDTGGTRREKPQRGPAAQALAALARGGAGQQRAAVPPTVQGRASRHGRPLGRPGRAYRPAPRPAGLDATGRRTACARVSSLKPATRACPSVR